MPIVGAGRIFPSLEPGNFGLPFRLTKPSIVPKHRYHWGYVPIVMYRTLCGGGGDQVSGLFVAQISPKAMSGSLDKVLVNTESNRTYHSGSNVSHRNDRTIDKVACGVSGHDKG